MLTGLDEYDISWILFCGCIICAVSGIVAMLLVKFEYISWYVYSQLFGSVASFIGWAYADYIEQTRDLERFCEMESDGYGN